MIHTYNLILRSIELLKSVLKMSCRYIVRPNKGEKLNNHVFGKEQTLPPFPECVSYVTLVMFTPLFSFLKDPLYTLPEIR